MAGRREADWKNQPQKLIDVLAMVVAAIMIAAYVYRGLVMDRTIYLGFALLFLILFVAYFTSFWQPILYIVGAMIVGVFSTILLVVGFWGASVDYYILFINAIIIVLSIYLFKKEEVWT